jgi:hypothetical protein
MKLPVIIVTLALTLAILLAASFLIATGTRGEDAPGRVSDPAGRSLLTPSAAKVSVALPATVIASSACDEAIQLTFGLEWIASRSLSSGSASRRPVGSQ